MRVTVNDQQWLAGLTEAQRGTGFASVVAVRRTGQAVVAGLQREVRSVFDRPTRWTTNAFYSVAPAGARRLAVATVGIKDRFPVGTPAAKYLSAQIVGGSRAQKRSEKTLAALGHLYGSRGFWVPGPGIRLNVYGNVPKATLSRILTAVKAARAAGWRQGQRGRSSAVVGARGDRYFVSPLGGGLAPGVWKESGARRRLIPVLYFVPTVRYAKRFDFFGVGGRLAMRAFPLELRRAIEQGFNQPRGE